MSKTPVSDTPTLVSTVTGDRPAEFLGVTLVHEHVIHRVSNFSAKDDNTCVDVDLMARELKRYRAAGGGAICDVTPIGVGRDSLALREVSLRSGVPIVTGVGVYDTSTYPAELLHATRKQWADYLLAEIFGADTGIQAGIIGEVASHNESHADWRKYRLLPIEETVFKAVADAQRQSGLFISTHASFGRQGVAQLRTLIDAGADPHQVIIGHCDALAHAADLARDMEYFHQLLDQGAWLEFDMFGWEELLVDELRFERIAKLVKQGYGGRLLLSMDICRRSQLSENGGRGFVYLFTHVIPGLRRWGLSEEAIRRLVVENPARVLGRPCSNPGVRDRSILTGSTVKILAREPVIAEPARAPGMRLLSQLAGWIAPLALASSAMAASDMPSADWVVPGAPYRITLELEDEPSQRSAGTPVSAQIDFDAVLRHRDISGRFDSNSVRIVQFDPKTGRPLSAGTPQASNFCGLIVPHYLNVDFTGGRDAGTIWWINPPNCEGSFHVYFDVLENGPKQPATEIQTLIGCGDSFYINDGKPGPINAWNPAYIIDWDSDGKRDLLCPAEQTGDYGMPTDRGLIRFFKNIGTDPQPLFDPGYHLRDQKGGLVETEPNRYMIFLLMDWDGDSDQDIVICEDDKLRLWENTGSRDRNNLPQLVRTDRVVQLQRTTDITTDYYWKSKPLLCDFDGDGDMDILYSACKQPYDASASTTDKVVKWPEVLQFFEIHEYTGRNEKGDPVFGSVKVLRTARGVPVFNFGYGGSAYEDWNGDGAPDLIITDMLNDPPGASRVLLYQNEGTRRDPLLTLPQEIVPRADGMHNGTPIVTDWDLDGDVDLMTAGPGLWLCRNIATDHKKPVLALGEPVLQRNPRVLGSTTSVVVDWNGDGRLDLVQGISSGYVEYWQNISDGNTPIFRRPVRLQADGATIRLINGRFECPQGASEPNTGLLTPVVVDWDQDDDLDLIVGDMRGYQTYFENKGTRRSPQLTAGRRMTVEGDERCLGWRNQLAVGDIDGDGNLEIVSTGYVDRTVAIYEPAKDQPDTQHLALTRINPLLSEAGQPLMPEQGTKNNNGDYKLKLADWDSDGDLDLFIGSLYHIWFYENIGLASAPRFKDHGKLIVDGKPLLVSNHAGSVEIVDWNKDGRMDLFIGGEYGWTFYFDRSYLDGTTLKTKIAGFETDI